MLPYDNIYRLKITGFAAVTQRYDGPTDRQGEQGSQSGLGSWILDPG